MLYLHQVNSRIVQLEDVEVTAMVEAVNDAIDIASNSLKSLWNNEDIKDVEEQLNVLYALKDKINQAKEGI